jgi:Family of unknown function (DUF5675)
MRTATLTRQHTSDVGTFGELVLDEGWKCITGELPWVDNKHGISCIPPAPNEEPQTYLCQWLYSENHKRFVYHVTNVPNRDAVEIHAGNWCGDKDFGYVTDVLGCMILGETVSPIEVASKGITQMGVTHSVKTVAEFERRMNTLDFELTVKWAS